MQHQNQRLMSVTTKRSSARATCPPCPSAYLLSPLFTVGKLELSLRFDLTKGDANRGLCFKSFDIVVNQAV